MAPEHFSGTMSKATDVFAFGMLLWEMVTGKKPYENMTQGEVIQSVSQVGARAVRMPWLYHDLPAATLALSVISAEWFHPA